MITAQTLFWWIKTRLILSTMWCISLLGFYSVSNALTWKCDFNSLAYLSTYTCNVTTTGSNIFYSFEYKPNSSWNWVTPWNQVVSMTTHAIKTSTWFQIIHNNRVWFAYSWTIHYFDWDATWTQWPKGDTWMTWLSAYQIAQGGWYTGSEMQWIESLKWLKWDTWAVTHEIVFSTWTLFSWSTFKLDNWNEDAMLSTGSTYIPTIAKVNWEYLVNWTWLRNIIFLIWLLIGTFYFLFKITIWKKSWLG